MDNKNLAYGMDLNKIDNDTIKKTIQVKDVVEEMGWAFYSHETVNGRFYITLELQKPSDRASE